MASTVPAKSQPLHNFGLPHLWKKNHHSNNHNRGRCGKLSSSGDGDSGSSPSRYSLQREDSGSESGKNRKAARSPQNSAPESGKNGALSTDQAIGKSEKKRKVSEVDRENRSKILLKLPRKIRAEEAPQEKKAASAAELQDAALVEEEAGGEPVSKTWNLRPRKPAHRNMNVDQFRGGGGATQENITQSCHRNVIRPEAEPNTSQRKKRLRFSISLSRDEIEEDIFSMTGSKPARRPKKRSKSVQKQLDSVFPGLWLASITPDSYKVTETQQKILAAIRLIVVQMFVFLALVMNRERDK
nr:neurofilament heavy polypeptide-like [Ipomoea batatas]